jgi:hypothetical protein
LVRVLCHGEDDLAERVPSLTDEERRKEAQRDRSAEEEALRRLGVGP